MKKWTTAYRDVLPFMKKEHGVPALVRECHALFLFVSFSAYGIMIMLHTILIME